MTKAAIMILYIGDQNTVFEMEECILIWLDYFKFGNNADKSVFF